MAEKDQPKRDPLSTVTKTEIDNDVGDCIKNWISDHREDPDDPESVVNRMSRGAWNSLAKKFSAREVSRKPLECYLIDDDGNFDKNPCISPEAEAAEGSKKKRTSHKRRSRARSSKATTPQQMPQPAHALTPKKLPTLAATVSSSPILSPRKAKVRQHQTTLPEVPQRPQPAHALTSQKVPTPTATVSSSLPLPQPTPCKAELAETTQHKTTTARPQHATQAQARIAIATQQPPTPTPMRAMAPALPQSSPPVKSPSRPEGLAPQSLAAHPVIDEPPPPISLLDQARAVVERVHASGVLDDLDEPPVVENSPSRRSLLQPVVARSACAPSAKALQKKQLKERLKLQIKQGLERLNFGMAEWEKQDKALEELFRKKVEERKERGETLKDCKFLLDSAAKRVASIQTSIDPELTRQSLDSTRHKLMMEIATFATKCKRETEAMAEENCLNRRFKPRELMELMKGQPGWSDPKDPSKEKMREARWEYLNSIYELQGKTLELLVTKCTVAYGLVPIAYKFEDIEKKPPAEETPEDARESITATINGRVQKLTVLSDEDLKKIQDLAIKGAEAEDNE